jgi:hypothetical protein
MNGTSAIVGGTNQPVHPVSRGSTSGDGRILGAQVIDCGRVAGHVVPPALPEKLTAGLPTDQEGKGGSGKNQGGSPQQPPGGRGDPPPSGSGSGRGGDGSPPVGTGSEDFGGRNWRDWTNPEGLNQAAALLRVAVPGEQAEQLLVNMAHVIDDLFQLAPDDVVAVMEGLAALCEKHAAADGGIPTRYSTDQGIVASALRRQRQNPAINDVLEALRPHVAIARLSQMSVAHILRCLKAAEVLTPGRELNGVLTEFEQHVKGAPQFSEEEFEHAIRSLKDLGACEGAVRLIHELWSSHGLPVVGKTNSLSHEMWRLKCISMTFSVLAKARPSKFTEQICFRLVPPLASTDHDVLANLAKFVAGMQNLRSSPGTELLLRELVVLLARSMPNGQIDPWSRPAIPAIRQIMRGMGHLSENPSAESMLRLLRGRMLFSLLDVEHTPKTQRLGLAERSRALAEAISYLEDHFESEAAPQFVVTMRDWLALSVSIDFRQLSERGYRQELIRELNGWPKGGRR